MNTITRELYTPRFPFYVICLPDSGPSDIPIDFKKKFCAGFGSVEEAVAKRDEAEQFQRFVSKPHSLKLYNYQSILSSDSEALWNEVYWIDSVVHNQYCTLSLVYFIDYVFGRKKNFCMSQGIEASQLSQWLGRGGSVGQQCFVTYMDEQWWLIAGKRRKLILPPAIFE
ncbi:hypothetical protein V6259_12830 [Marinomonas sp. TI.3.20]|uniref:hypothetical protein n=1 Tax=Marinomonas sp. TI.3.20 TaxID=3121296 RepID=UPI00311FBD1C